MLAAWRPVRQTVAMLSCAVPRSGARGRHGPIGAIEPAGTNACICMIGPGGRAGGWWHTHTVAPGVGLPCISYSVVTRTRWQAGLRPSGDGWGRTACPIHIASHPLALLTPTRSRPLASVKAAAIHSSPWGSGHSVSRPGHQVSSTVLRAALRAMVTGTAAPQVFSRRAAGGCEHGHAWSSSSSGIARRCRARHGGWLQACLDAGVAAWAWCGQQDDTVASTRHTGAFKYV